MEVEDQDSKDTEKPNINFDTSLPTSHVVCGQQYSRFLNIIIIRAAEL